ncbi:MAG: tRNA(Met) cytidine acetyltransferase [Crenarchaeota archaeon]|nr:tRNA(Met) cytidine acetyltransferase [Thermoproteota archaeon]
MLKQFLERLEDDLENAVEGRHRRLVVLSGDDPEKLGRAAREVLLLYDRIRTRRDLGKGKVLYMFHDEFEDSKKIKDIVKKSVKESAQSIKLDINVYETSNKLLGTTYQGLVLDLTHDLKPNDVGRLVEVVEGGGPVILLVPKWERWDTVITLFKKLLTVPQYPEPRHVFITWFKRKTLQHPAHIFHADEEKIIKQEPFKSPKWVPKEPEYPEKTRFPKKLYELALTQDQVNVINAMEWLLGRKKKHRVLIVTADRGRGKSGAVGIGLAGFLKVFAKSKNAFVRVIVTSADPVGVQTLFKLLIKAAQILGEKTKKIERGGNVFEVRGEGWSVEYWPPVDAAEKPADLVVVDEAAGIPVPVLYKIWKKHKRSLFATTIHGYEGAGRGFNVRFLPALKKDRDTELKHVTMSEPIRYAPGDPVERWLYDVLLLDAEPAKLTKEDIKAIKEKKLKYLRLDPEWLFSEEGEETLRQLFGIYVLAHYRNEPDDLAMIADAPHHTPRAVMTETGKVVGAVHLAEEGPIPEDMVDDLLTGGKIPGNIIPDRFLKHLRVREFAFTKGWRIVRIATHPDVQGMGVGTFALQEVSKEARERGYDWVASGFGVTEQLLRFWLRSGFLPVHMSPDRNPSSGEFTILVAKPLSQSLRTLIWEANRLFRRRLLFALHLNYKGLEWDVAKAILEEDPLPIQPDLKVPHLHPVDLDRLWIYAYGPMTFEAASDLVYRLALAYWSQPRAWRPELDEESRIVIITKVLQGKSWDEVSEETGIGFKKQVAILKSFARKSLKHYWGIEDEGGRGVRKEAVDIFLSERGRRLLDF